MASDMPNPMWNSHTETNVPPSPQLAVDLEQGHDRDEVRHDEQADDEQEHHVAAGEAHERERVGGEGRDEDRDERRR
jgi:hypothetical protein